MSRPNEQPSWCDDDAASKVVEPSPTKKLQGFIYEERPAFQFWNWVQRNFVKWILHIDVSVNHFDPHEASTPDMTVEITAGKVQAGTTITSIAAQASATITAPATDPRIDRIVIDDSTGVISIIAGTEAASPVAPALTSGKIAVAQVLLQTSSTSITDSMITDERSSYYRDSVLHTKVIEIGDWNMDADSIKDVTHGLTQSLIRSVSVVIRSDSPIGYYVLEHVISATDTTAQGGIQGIGSSAISLRRLTGGFFDDVAFNGTSYNRGWVTIQYED